MRSTHCGHMTERKSGFTLIELLVVIAIIAILAAILFPVFARARENARRSSCQSNLKQLGLGIMQYSQDYDEKMPRSYNNANGFLPYMGMIYPYVKSTQLFFCPSDSVNPGRAGAFKTNSASPTGVSGRDMSYSGTVGKFNTAANPSLRGPMPIENTDGVVGLSDMQVPSTTVLLCDTFGPADLGEAFYYYTVAPKVLNETPRRFGQPDGTVPSPIERHLETTNVLWCDGHVKAMKLDALAVPSSVDATAAKFFTIADD